jgi:hypothetical protein
VTEASEEIRAAADPEANIIFGTTIDERLGDEVMITVIATGFDGKPRREQPRREQATHPWEVGRDTRAPRQERDFLTELERQRLQPDATDRPRPDDRTGRSDASRSDASHPTTERAAVEERPATPLRTERPTTDPAPSVRRQYDADDLEIPSFLRRK